MDPKKLFFDERLTGFCVYCGATPSTRDHVPSKVLLDEPYPSNLPVVLACEKCNNGFSKDEQYLACFVECVINGSTDQTLIKREKIQRNLCDNPALRSLIDSSKRIDDKGNTYWIPDINRIMNVIVKLARGHAVFECSEPQLDEPEYISLMPFAKMSDDQIELFNTPPVERGWPEIGSRAFCQIVVADNQIFNLRNGWLVVQEERYRYLVSYSEGMKVRIVLSEYLACEVGW